MKDKIYIQISAGLASGKTCISNLITDMLEKHGFEVELKDSDDRRSPELTEKALESLSNKKTIEITTNNLNPKLHMANRPTLNYTRPAFKEPMIENVIDMVIRQLNKSGRMCLDCGLNFRRTSDEWRRNLVKALEIKGFKVRLYPPERKTGVKQYIITCD